MLFHGRGLSLDAIQAEYPLGRKALSDVVHYKSWRHVGDEGEGASTEDWLPPTAPPSQAEKDAAAASLAKLQGMLGEPALPLEEIMRREFEAGAARDAQVQRSLQAPLQRGAQLLDELACKPPGGVLDSVHGGHPPVGTDEGASMKNVPGTHTANDEPAPAPEVAELVRELEALEKIALIDKPLIRRAINALSRSGPSEATATSAEVGTMLEWAEYGTEYDGRLLRICHGCGANLSDYQHEKDCFAEEMRARILRSAGKLAPADGGSAAR